LYLPKGADCLILPQIAGPEEIQKNNTLVLSFANLPPNSGMDIYSYSFRTKLDQPTSNQSFFQRA
jgi:hypothetical protein